MSTPPAQAGRSEDAGKQQPRSLLASRFPTGNASKRQKVTHAETKPAAAAVASAIGTGDAGGDEEDPLDAFMNSVRDQAKADLESMQQRVAAEKQTRAGTKRTSNNDSGDGDGEEDDNIESYVKFMRDKGIHVGQPRDQQQQQHGVPDADVDSDEEVYRTAREIDQQLADTNRVPFSALSAYTRLNSANDPDGPGADDTQKREIEPLASLDHSTVEYQEIEKCFYEEHPDIAVLSEERVAEIRRELDIKVFGHDVAKPCISFAHFGFDDALMNAIVRAGYSEPTGIQKQSVPNILSGRDLIGIAATGSGKTLAFVWPMLIHLMDQEELSKGDGPIGLVLAPTRELAQQIYIEAKKFAKAYGLKVACVTGGASKGEQWKELRGGGVEILIATPGRLIDLVKMKATNLRRVTYLVLDEADRMFDLGFEPQVSSVCDNIRPDRQTLLFSATFAPRVESLARRATTDPIKIVIGNVGQANADVAQKAVVFEDEEAKWAWLTERLVRLSLEGSIILFATRKASVDELSIRLMQQRFECGPLHGDMVQQERDQMIREFKNGKFPILVATDVAARGLDIKSVKTVINYEVPRDIDSHTHRIGRTGRAGEKGVAFTLLTQKDDRFAGELVYNMESANQEISPELLNLAMKNAKFRNARGGRGFGRGRGRSRGRGRGRGGRGRGRGGYERYGESSGSYGALSGHGGTAVPSGMQARNALYSAFRPATSQTLPGSVQATTDHSSTASAPTATPSNPLLAAFERHKQKMKDST
ncbi:hypothetical protein RI367_004784 [Sorochytrium milnesiophthora]